MYLSTFEARYLSETIKLVEKMIEELWDSERGAFFQAKESSELILRNKEIYDGAVPSGNSVAAYVLYLLYRITGDTRYQKYANETLNSFAKEIKAIKSAHSFALLVQDLLFSEPIDIVIASRDKKEIDRFLEQMRKNIQKYAGACKN
ncbi:hypothetical protein PL321_18680 [Caloramator sp. mosi_1]|uniref:hypothetical protein n=1 Tax=Caloramator sp. mosi_1 TaxID=3023090 RepID=UPI0023626FFD|nr:hypothetical protein [Caloramator sp. mosi_1]WDC84223.1 hypothetical protein PL321_18680 [Caloramator sp. mosi_1]